MHLCWDEHKLIICVIAIGVDLGTTFSVVGINKHGKVIIVEDKQKHKIFPSVVSFLDNGGKFHRLSACTSKAKL